MTHRGDVGDGDAVRVSIEIVTWNAGHVLRGCLTSLHLHSPSGPGEAIVVDNASADDTIGMLAAEAPWARVIANPENVGLAAANNQGLAASRGRAILISNPDVIFSHGAVDALCAALDRHPRAAFVVPRLLHPDGRVQTSACALPSFREAYPGRAASQSRASAAAARRGFWWDGWAHDEEVPIG